MELFSILTSSDNKWPKLQSVEKRLAKLLTLMQVKYVPIKQSKNTKKRGQYLITKIK